MFPILRGRLLKEKVDGWVLTSFVFPILRGRLLKPSNIVYIPKVGIVSNP